MKFIQKFIIWLIISQKLPHPASNEQISSCHKNVIYFNFVRTIQMIIIKFEFCKIHKCNIILGIYNNTYKDFEKILQR